MTPKNVRARRIALGMSVPDLAKAFGVTVDLLQDFEEGRKPLPKAEHLRPVLESARKRASASRHLLNGFVDSRVGNRLPPSLPSCMRLVLGYDALRAVSKGASPLEPSTTPCPLCAQPVAVNSSMNWVFVRSLMTLHLCHCPAAPEEASECAEVATKFADDVVRDGQP